MNAKDYLEGHWMKNRVWKRLELPVHQERLRRCAEAVKGGRTFIDVGCGLGHSTAILKRFCPGDWTGMDFYGPAIAQARELFPGIAFLAADFKKDVPSPDSWRWDGVVCSEVIEHVDDAKGFISSLWEITLGSLVVTTPSVKVNDPGHLRLYTEASLREAFRGVPGAKIERGGRFFYITAERKA